MTKTVGFTGTQRGMTKAQQVTVAQLLLVLRENGYEILRQGCCIGSDEQCALLAKACPAGKYIVIGHPPRNESKMSRVAFDACDSRWPPEEYLVRNRDVVVFSDYLIATPYQDHEIVRSGAWAAMRSACHNRMNGVIVWPDGKLNSISEMNELFRNGKIMRQVR